MRKCKHGKKCPLYYKKNFPITLQRKVNVKKDVFSSCHERGIKKDTDSSWGIEPQTFGIALRCSTTEPQDSSVSEVYYEVLITRVLHTARISNVDSVMFLTGRVSLELRNGPRSPKSLCGSVVEHRSANPKVWGSIPHGDSEFFLCPTLVTRRKNIFLNSSSSSKLTISTISIKGKCCLFITWLINILSTHALDDSVS